MKDGVDTALNDRQSCIVSRKQGDIWLVLAAGVLGLGLAVGADEDGRAEEDTDIPDTVLVSAEQIERQGLSAKFKKIAGMETKARDKDVYESNIKKIWAELEKLSEEDQQKFYLFIAKDLDLTAEDPFAYEREWTLVGALLAKAKGQDLIVEILTKTPPSSVGFQRLEEYLKTVSPQTLTRVISEGAMPQAHLDEPRKADEIGWYITFEKNPGGKKSSTAKSRTVYCWNGEEIGDDEIGVERLLERIEGTNKQCLHITTSSSYYPLKYKRQKLPAILTSNFADITKVCKRRKIQILIRNDMDEGYKIKPKKREGSGRTK